LETDCFTVVPPQILNAICLELKNLNQQIATQAKIIQQLKPELNSDMRLTPAQAHKEFGIRSDILKKYALKGLIKYDLENPDSKLFKPIFKVKDLRLLELKKFRNQRSLRPKGGEA